MVKSESHIPKLRFKGFSDDLRNQSARDIFVSISDKNHGSLPVLSATQDRGMVYRDEVGIDIKFDKKTLNNYKKVKVGQFVIHLRSFQGGLAFSDIEGITSPAYTVLDFKESDVFYSKYWKEVLSSNNFIKKLESITYGIRDGRSISFSDFSILNFYYPELKEQTKIGNFFQKIDQVIELQQKSLDTARDYKKSMLQKMFPQKGEKVPQIRFDGFNGDWEEKPMNKIAKIVGGGTPDTNIAEYWNGNIDWYAPAEIGKSIYVDNSKRKITELGLQKSSAKVLPAYRTILFTSRAGIGDMAILKKDSATNQGFQSFVINTENNVYFIYSMGFLIKQDALKIASGSTFLEISGKALGAIKQYLPSFEEQQKIGAFFQKLDQQIEQQEKKLESYQNLKKAMLQRMFV